MLNYFVYNKYMKQYTRNGETLSIRQWANRYNISYDRAKLRLEKNIPLENFENDLRKVHTNGQVCSIEDCQNLAKSKGMCDVHRTEDYRNKNRELLRNKQRKFREIEPYPHKIIRHVKSRCKILNIPFNLTVDDIVMPEFCEITGNKLDYKNFKNSNFATLDRLIPEKGYVKGNVKIISKKMNILKSNGSIKDFQSIIDYIKRHIGENK